MRGLLLAQQPVASTSYTSIAPCVRPRSHVRPWARRSAGYWPGSRVACRATDNEEPPADQQPGGSGAPRIQRTLADLDALLGIQADATGPAPATPPTAPSASGSPATTPSAPASAQGQPPQGALTPDSMRQSMADAQQQQRQQSGGVDPTKAQRDALEVQFQRIIEKARKLADEQSKAGGAGQQEAEQAQLRQEFESLLSAISNSPATLDKEDVKRLKEAAFGPQTFFITETQQLATPDRTGLLVRGNLRDERQKVYEHVCKKVTELFGEKYAVIMVEDEEAMQEAANNQATGLDLGTLSSPRTSGAASKSQELNTPRVAFQIIPAAQAVPPQPNGWKRAVAVLLMLLFLGSCGQLALAANITKLPRETLEWFANPANFEQAAGDVLPPGLEAWDPLPYFSTAVPIYGAVLGCNLVHEVGHRIAAAMRGVKLGPTYFIPNFQIGSFGAITPIISTIKDRLQLWDVAAAGPLAGTLFSLSLLLIGLSQSQPGELPADALVPVPTPLFQGSLLLGGVTRLFLGETALRAAEVPVSPLVIAGWCGLITQALQLLPVGCVDGGRLVQGAYGRGALALTSFFTYLGLGLGLLGSSLALPYGIYVVICQRAPEKYVADNVTPAGDARAAATLAAVMFAILVLVPMAPELADSLGVGAGRDALL